jgi:hypothetical protein
MIAAAIAPFSTIYDFVPDVDGITLPCLDFGWSHRGLAQLRGNLSS